jgi:hypothetical protein
MKLILVFGLLGVACGCATHDSQCSTVLRPINVAKAAPARVPPPAAPAGAPVVLP